MRAPSVSTTFTARGTAALISLHDAVALGVAHEIGLVEHDEVGAQELVLVHLLQRVVVVDGGVVHALAHQRFGVVGEAPVGHRRAVDDGDHAVDGDARGDRRPVEGLHQRFGQRQPRSLDQDVLGRIGEGEQAFQRRHEIVGDRAADAAVGQLDDAILATGRRPRSL